MMLKFPQYIMRKNPPLLLFNQNEKIMEKVLLQSSRDMTPTLTTRTTLERTRFCFDTLNLSTIRDDFLIRF